jgi:SAM-dependent methyltransferase
VPTLVGELGLDGRGRLLDVGCGPGVVAVELAGQFDEAVGLDPDADMLAEAAMRAADLHVTNITWRQGLAEDMPELSLGRFRLVTFGQSFHRTERERVAESVYELLEKGGAMVCIAPTVEGRPVPGGPDLPTIPHEEVMELVQRYLGPRLRSGQGYVSLHHDRMENALARTRFGGARIVFAPGRTDLVRDVDSVVSNYFSMTYSAPHLYGDRRAVFEADLRALLLAHSPEGLFWDWPGDTELVIAEKPG